MQVPQGFVHDPTFHTDVTPAVTVQAPPGLVPDPTYTPVAVGSGDTSDPSLIKSAQQLGTSVHDYLHELVSNIPSSAKNLLSSLDIFSPTSALQPCSPQR